MGQHRAQVGSSDRKTSRLTLWDREPHPQVLPTVSGPGHAFSVCSWRRTLTQGENHGLQKVGQPAVFEMSSASVHTLWPRLPHQQQHTRNPYLSRFGFLGAQRP